MSLTLDYLDAARAGDRLELATTVDRTGGRTVFATCRVTVGERLIVRASLIFSLRRPG